jgi:uncharacterized membrane protein
MKLVRAAVALHFTALAIWVGGLAAIGAVVAPVAFQTDRSVAGAIVGGSLRAFGRVEIVCAVVALFTAVLAQAVGVWGKGVRWPRILGLVAMAALTLAYTQAVYPPLEELRPRVRAGDPAARADFDRLHRMSTRLVGANLLLGIAVLGLSASTMKSPEGS